MHGVTISGIIKSKDTKPILGWGALPGTWLNKTGYGNTQIRTVMVDMENSMANWPENLPKSGLYVPLRQDGKLRGGLVLLRRALGATDTTSCSTNWLKRRPIRLMLEAGVHGLPARRARKISHALCAIALLALSF